MATTTTAPASHLLFNAGAAPAKMVPTAGQNGRGSALAQQNSATAAASPTATSTAAASSTEAGASPAKAKNSAGKAAKIKTDAPKVPENLYEVPIRFYVSPEHSSTGMSESYSIPVREYDAKIPAGTKFLLKELHVSADMAGQGNVGIAFEPFGGTKVVSMKGGVTGSPYHVEVQRLDGCKLAPVTVAGHKVAIDAAGNNVDTAGYFTRYGHIASADALKAEGIQFVDASREFWVMPESPVGRFMRQNNRQRDDGTYRYFDPTSDKRKIKGEQVVDSLTQKKVDPYVIVLPHDTPHIDSVASSIGKNVLESAAFRASETNPSVQLKVVPLLKQNDPAALANLPPINVHGVAKLYAFNVPQAPTTAPK